jgi:hypothetical protein
MKAVITDSESRVTIPGASPRQKFWIIEDRAGYRLQRIPEHSPGRRMSREEVLRAIRDCELTFPRDWEEIRAETREP